MADPLSKQESWNQLRRDFQALSAAIASSGDRRLRIEAASHGAIISPDPSLRFQAEQLTMRAGLALGAEPDQAMTVWIDAVSKHLEEQDSDWLKDSGTSRWVSGPVKVQNLPLSTIRDESKDALAPPHEADVSRVREAGRFLGHLGVVKAERRAGYVVLDDSHEREKYHICVAAGFSHVTCGIRQANDIGHVAEEEHYLIQHFDRASADLCMAMETAVLAALAHARSRGPKVSVFDRAQYQLDTADGRKAAVGDFLACCNHLTTQSIEQKHIWKAIKHRTPRELQYWIAHNKKGTKATDSAVRRILEMGPAQFTDSLKSRGLIS